MSHMIVKRITITSDLRVMVRRATNNLRPLDFRYGEVESLTELLRTKGRPALERELLSLFFKGCWQGWNRYSRAVEYALITDRLDKYEAYEHTLLLRMRGFLHYRPVPCRCHLEYQRCPVWRISAGCICLSWQKRRIFQSVLEAQATLVNKGWNPDNFRIVEEETNNPKSEIR
jgi:hypothetical protein